MNTIIEEENQKTQVSFAGLGLGEKTLAAVERIGFVAPSEIQEKFIPAALTDRDCIGRARTGTGKTAAFLLPLFHRFYEGEKIRVLVIVPTRELAEQIKVECRKMTGDGPPRSLAVYGGTKIEPQIKRLKNKPEIVVGTPGRLLDHGQRRTMDFSEFTVVVLDEVDRMFDMGFRKDIGALLRQCKNRRQIMFLSATLPPDIMRLAERFLRDPIRISAVEEENPSVENLDQSYFAVSARRKFALLDRLLKRDNPELALIFCRTKRGTERIGRRLREKHYNSSFIHGDLPQSRRDKAISSFREKKVNILVATDVMGRGIDVPGITHIINYDLPDNPEDYLHRVGRSARMKASGKAIAFITPEQGELLSGIEMLCNMMLREEQIPGFHAGLDDPVE